MSISLLPVRLQLLTFPKESLPYVTHAILKNVLFKKQNKFFSYTENSMEISIIADVETIENDFPKNNSPTCPYLCICEDPFRALQIDNEYGLEMSGKRINDLSAPLAQAGISIFYLSTYQTDFIFVKEKRIPLVVSVLKKSFQFIDLDLLNIEFPMYLSNNDDQFLPPENVSSWLSYDYDGNEEVDNQKLIESQKDTDFDGKESEETSEETEREADEEADQVGALNIPDDYRRNNYSNETAMGWSYSPTYDFSSLSLVPKLPRQEDILVEVRRQCKKSLSDKSLRLIGLNREYMEGWALVMMKIMFYPELLKTEEEIENDNSSRFFSYTSTDEGISLIVEEQILELFEEHMINMSLTPRPLRCIQIDLTTFGVGTLRLDRCGIVYSMSDPLTKSGINLLYLSTFKTANVLVNESMLNQTLEVLDIYGEDKDSKESEKEEKEKESVKSKDTNIKELVTKIKDYSNAPKINPYRDSNYLRSVSSHESESNYLAMNRNKAINYTNYEDSLSQQRSSSTILNPINGYNNVNLQYPESVEYSNNTSPSNSHILMDSYHSSPNENHTNGNQMNSKLGNSLSRIGLSNMYGQPHYSVSISPTTVTAEPSSTTMNSVTVKPSNNVTTQHYITNRSYYDFTYDNKIQAYTNTNTTTVNGNNYRKDDMSDRTISYFQQYHPINPTNRMTSDVYTTSGFTFK
ncbi:hypothetical protein BCR36DRAFT_343556 [Piromyces finnis]|uniref:CASTOR ACT domain-containing protein n=1 Tax=Piromyces finnis TaxID=1754191 RepID=A0A1Y1VKW6_9FUNG|nr:hypothetical protein BCR36DRAFT_343556 [Piromyces finnis]|eukprot:ORX58399.1 hypothetical protein BCR36DRAFT_343556 [Piromyces finnis]